MDIRAVGRRGKGGVEVGPCCFNRMLCQTARRTSTAFSIAKSDLSQSMQFSLSPIHKKQSCSANGERESSYDVQRLGSSYSLSLSLSESAWLFNHGNPSMSCSLQRQDSVSGLVSTQTVTDYPFMKYV